MIEISVKGNMANIIGQDNVITSGSVNYDKVKFTITGDGWTGLTKKAVIYKTLENPYTSALDSEDVATIPWECLTTPGRIHIGLYGEKVTEEEIETRLPTNILDLVVIDGAYKEGQTPTPPTPTEFQLLLLSLANKVDKDGVKVLTDNNFSDEDKQRLASTTEGLDNKVDKVVGERLINAAEIVKVGNLSGTNTGDQDLSGKVDKVTGKGLSTNDYTDVDKGLVDGAIQASEKGVSDGVATLDADGKLTQMPTPSDIGTYTEQEIYDGFATKVEKVTGKSLVADTEITRLAGMATGANNYVHPITHSPSIIVQDANNRFVTDAEKAVWEQITAVINSKGAVNGIATLDPYGNLVQTSNLSPVSTTTYSASWLTGTLSVDSGTNIFTYTGADFAGYANGSPIEFDNGTGVLPSGITATTGMTGVYYNIIGLTGTNPYTFQICATVGGSTPVAVVTTGTAGFKMRMAGVMSAFNITGLDLNAKKKYKVIAKYGLVKKTTSAEAPYFQLNGLTGGAGFGNGLSPSTNTNIAKKYSKANTKAVFRLVDSTSFLINIQSQGQSGDDGVTYGTDHTGNLQLLETFTSGNLTSLTFVLPAGTGVNSYIRNGTTVYVFEEA